jgi:hypothetical protein
MMGGYASQGRGAGLDAPWDNLRVMCTETGAGRIEFYIYLILIGKTA